MNENVNSSCALPHHTDNWNTIMWRKVIHRVRRLQRRIAKAVKEGRWGKAKALMYLVSKSFYAKLLAVFRVTTNKGGNTPGVDNTVWKSGKEKLHTPKGTPQGGIISPTIMNMVLDGMEQVLKSQFPRWKGQKVNFIRYADDFIVTASTREALNNEVIPLVKDFLKVRGLSLSEDKSKITHINEGFDFLSQNIRKYKGKLLIRPSRESIQSFRNKLKAIVRNNRGIPAHALIRLLNPVIRGWSNYHKGICAKSTFSKMGTFIFRQLRRWAKYQHANKNRHWIFRRYFLNNHFTDCRNSRAGMVCERLYRIAHVPIRYHVKVKSIANPYLPEFDKYFFLRKKWREDLAKVCKQFTAFNGTETNFNSRVSLRRESLLSA
jgi:RNA-directed DNA polymerase